MDEKLTVKEKKERVVKLQLHDTEITKLWYCAEDAGLTVSELLEQFIRDLVEVNCTNESVTAQEWLEERAALAEGQNITFLHYLVGNSFESDSEPENLPTVKKVVAIWAAKKAGVANNELMQNLHDMYNAYQKDYPDAQTIPFEEQVEEVIKWYKAMLQMTA